MATHATELTELFERLSLLEKMYEDIRFVDPVNKQVIPIKSGTPPAQSNCYDYWAKGVPCENCISMRAYRENNTYFKIEYINDHTIMITAIPVDFQGRIVIMEFIKDVTHSMVFENKSGDTRVENLVSHMNNLAVRDELTGLYNRRFINERLPADLAGSLIKQESISLLMVDLDNFKLVNDNYGHLAGDLVLQKFGELLQNSVRKNMDWVARYGGEEFLICLHNTSLADAVKKAETIRQNLRQFVVHYYDVTLSLTASFGVCAFYNQEVSLEGAIECVDKKLYQAKEDGRDRVSY